jgi:hypothetical protein
MPTSLTVAGSTGIGGPVFVERLVGFTDLEL